MKENMGAGVLSEGGHGRTRTTGFAQTAAVRVYGPELAGIPEFSRSVGFLVSIGKPPSRIATEAVADVPG